MICVCSSSSLLAQIAIYVPCNIKYICVDILSRTLETFRLSSRSSIVFPSFVDDRIKNLPYQRFISIGMVWLAIVWACLMAEVIVFPKYKKRFGNCCLIIFLRFRLGYVPTIQ